MNAALRENFNSTPTSEGRIDHLELATDSGIIFAPVKIDWLKSCVREVKFSRELPVPLRRKGRLVYALPGGGEFIP